MAKSKGMYKCMEIRWGYDSSPLFFSFSIVLNGLWKTTKIIQLTFDWSEKMILYKVKCVKNIKCG